jgi:hypothetical protein
MKRYSIWFEAKMLGRLRRVAESKGIKTAQLIRMYILAGLRRDKG